MNPSAQLYQISSQLRNQASADQINSALRAPVIILSAPRSGSTLLFEYLTTLPGTSWIGGESHRVFRHFPELGIASASFDSASLNESHADDRCKSLFRDNMAYLLRNSKGQSFIENPSTFLNKRNIMIEKTPRNALNIRFLNRIFPDAKFVFLHRTPEDNIASLMEAWSLGLKTGRFVTFPQLPGWDRRGWCFLLPPGWRDMIGKSLAEIAAFQWQKSNQTIIDDLNTMPRKRFITVGYEQLLANPQPELTRLLKFMDIPNPDQCHQHFAEKPSSTTVSTPAVDKWKRYETEISSLMPALKPLRQAIDNLETNYA